MIQLLENILIIAGIEIFTKHSNLKNPNVYALKSFKNRIINESITYFFPYV